MVSELVLEFLIPLSPTEHHSQVGSSREPLFEPESRFSAIGELGSRPAWRGAQGTARCLRGAATRAAFSLVSFFWPDKRNRPWVQGRSNPQLAFEHRA